MKAILLLLISVNCFSQQGEYKFFDTGCKEKCDTSIEKIDGYEVQFIYNPYMWMDDLVFRMKCDSVGQNCVELENPKHYYATVRVYKNKKQIGDVMSGYYIKGQTCWDADPEAYLRQAKKVDAQRTKR